MIIFTQSGQMLTYYLKTSHDYFLLRPNLLAILYLDAGKMI
jgi:hypothetical protein